jgi:GMP synthase-like glutamine amidotransferase
VFHLYRDATLPSLSDFDMLTVMGGPMSANDEARLGWLGPEIALVREAIGADKTVLGICLGAQIIARALGARVYPGSAKEIGWFPVQRTAGSHPLDRATDLLVAVCYGPTHARRDHVRSDLRVNALPQPP